MLLCKCECMYVCVYLLMYGFSVLHDNITSINETHTKQLEAENFRTETHRVCVCASVQLRTRASMITSTIYYCIALFIFGLITNFHSPNKYPLLMHTLRQCSVAKKKCTVNHAVFECYYILFLFGMSAWLFRPFFLFPFFCFTCACVKWSKLKRANRFMFHFNIRVLCSLFVRFHFDLIYGTIYFSVFLPRTVNFIRRRTF